MALTAEQQAEARRLVREEGLTEEQARTLVTETQYDPIPVLPDPPAERLAPELEAAPDGYVIDIDSDDSFLDLPEPLYEGRTPEESSAAIDRLLESDEPALPLPPVERD